MTTTDASRGFVDVHPVPLPDTDERAAEVPSRRPHYIVRVDPDGAEVGERTEYADRAGARAAAVEARRAWWCPVREFDAKGTVRKVTPGVVSR